MSNYHKQALKQSIILGIYFMLTYTTFLSFSCIITYITDHQQQDQYKYGPLAALAVNYLTYTITLVFSPAIKNFKWQFQVSAITHLINYAVYIPGFKGELGVMMGIIGGLFGGYGAAIYWVSQGGYLMKLFKLYNINKNQEGKYFGITNGIVYGSSLFGALVTTFGLGFFGSQTYFIILAGLAFVSWLVCTVFLDSLQRGSPVDSLLSESQSLQPRLSNRNSESTNEPLCNQIKSIFLKTMRYYPKMYYMFIPIVLDGIISGFISIYFSNLINSDIRTNLNVGFLLMIQGVGCIFGAMLSAFMADKYYVIDVGRAGMVLILVTSAITMVNYFINTQTMYFPLVVGLLWGFIINYLTSWESVSCAKLNEGCLESFSIVRQVQAITYILFTVVMIATGNVIDLPFFICAIAVFCLLAMVVLLIYKRWNHELLAKNDLQSQE